MLALGLLISACGQDGDLSEDTSADVAVSTPIDANEEADSTETDSVDTDSEIVATAEADSTEENIETDESAETDNAEIDSAEATATAIIATVDTTASDVMTDSNTVTSTSELASTEAMTDTASSGSMMTDELDLATLPPLSTDMTDMTIGEIISSTEGFGVLASVLNNAAFLDALNAAGPITLFAPTDNAFALYPSEAIDELLANPDVLLELLQYHVVMDSASSADLVEIGSTVTMLGEFVDISIDADGTYQANDAVITQTDIQAANGTIHVVNGLLIPPSATAFMTSRTVNPQAETDTGANAIPLETFATADTSDMTVLEVINAIDGFTTLAAAVDSAGLNDALSAAGPITILAPVNGAFDVIPDADLEDLLNSNLEELIRILQYHTILDLTLSANLADLPSVLVATGDTITVTVDDSSGLITLNDGAATVFMADIEASNGVVHAISTVLMPPIESP